MTSICDEKISAEAQLIHAEQMSLPIGKKDVDKK